VYAVLAWALGHPDDVEGYLKRRDAEAAELRRQLEDAGLTPTREERAELRKKLLAQREGQQR
jgi:hypothetical protein